MRRHQSKHLFYAFCGDYLLLKRDKVPPLSLSFSLISISFPPSPRRQPQSCGSQYTKIPKSKPTPPTTQAKREEGGRRGGFGRLVFVFVLVLLLLRRRRRHAAPR